MTAAKSLPLRIHALRRLNPMIACVLKSPLHSVASTRLLVLRYPGRKSGRMYTIPLSYVTHGERIYCVTRDTAWWKSAVNAPSVTLWLRGLRLTARAERMPRTAEATRAAFEKFLTENPGTARMLYNTRIDADGRPDRDDVEREIQHSKVVCFTVLPTALIS